jgi:hypothetical protein
LSILLLDDNNLICVSCASRFFVDQICYPIIDVKTMARSAINSLRLIPLLSLCSPFSLSPFTFLSSFFFPLPPPFFPPGDDWASAAELRQVFIGDEHLHGMSGSSLLYCCAQPSIRNPSISYLYSVFGSDHSYIRTRYLLTSSSCKKYRVYMCTPPRPCPLLGESVGLVWWFTGLGAELFSLHGGFSC